MRYFLPLSILSFLLVSCFQTEKDAPKPDGFVRVNATIQGFSEVQPWDRKEPAARRGLGALLANKQILTTSEMVANQVYLELESADGTNKITAKVVAIDRGANLALLEPEDMEAECFLDNLTPIALSPALNLGDKVETWQLENNGQPTVTTTNIYAVDVVSSHSEGQRFFSYMLKGSLQSASNSFTVPVLSSGKLAGILTSYDSDDQISEVVSSSIIEQFLDDAADGEYEGFPSLGIAGARMPDKAFRSWVGLEEGEEGLYITRVAQNSAAAESGIEVADVLLEMDGKPLDRKGYYTDEKYGKLSWTHLIRGSKGAGETLELKLKREGEIIQKSVILKPAPKKLIPDEFDPRGPQYLIKGGVIFQHLTKKYLQAYGKDWTTRAPLNLLELYFQPEKYEDKLEEVVVITGVIPSQNTVGYENVRNAIIEKVNDTEITKLADLAKGFASPIDGIHHIQLSESPFMIYLDAKACEMVDKGLLGQGLPALSRVHEEKEAE